MFCPILQVKLISIVEYHVEVGIESYDMRA